MTMVAFAPEYGLASTISITALLSADVRMDFTVKHFQSLEEDDLKSYTMISICGFVLAGVILVDKIYTIQTNDKDFHENLPGFLVDILVQVVLPIIYFGIRLAQVSASKDVLSGTNVYGV